MIEWENNTESFRPREGGKVDELESLINDDRLMMGVGYFDDLLHFVYFQGFFLESNHFSLCIRPLEAEFWFDEQ